MSRVLPRRGRRVQPRAAVMADAAPMPLSRNQATNRGMPSLTCTDGAYPRCSRAREMSASVRRTSPGCAGSRSSVALLPTACSISAHECGERRHRRLAEIEDLVSRVADVRVRSIAPSTPCTVSVMYV